MEIIVTQIVIAILAVCIGVVIDLKIRKKRRYPKLIEAKHTPIVVSMVFKQPPTKSLLLNDVLKPNEIMFEHHFAPKANLFDAEISNKVLNKNADEIMRWYNPEYNELLLIAHPTGKLQEEGNQTFTVDFLWKKP